MYTDKKTKFSSYIRKLRWDRLQVIDGEGLPNMGGNAQIPNMRRPLVIYDFANAPF
jgi:hypothetical protein